MNYQSPIPTLSANAPHPTVHQSTKLKSTKKFTSQIAKNQLLRIDESAFVASKIA